MHPSITQGQGEVQAGLHLGQSMQVNRPQQQKHQRHLVGAGLMGGPELNARGPQVKLYGAVGGRL